MTANVKRDRMQFVGDYKAIEGLTDVVSSDVSRKQLEALFNEHLKNFKNNHNGTMPSTVMVYRNGVSDGSFAEVRNELHFLAK